LSTRTIAPRGRTREDVGMVSLVGAVIQTAIAVLYVRAAMRPSPRGNRWPLHRTLCFLSGLLLLSLAIQVPWTKDDVIWVHSAEHLVTMMAAPPLLVLGAPLTLLLRSVGPNARREIVGILHDPAMKKVSGPVAGIGLALEYHGTMFLVMLTGLYGYTLEHEWAHVLTHLYLFSCGLLFWMPLVGKDPAGFRPPRWAKVAMVASGIPAYVLLGLLMNGRDVTAAYVLGVGGVLLTLAGLVLLATQRAGRRAGSASRGPDSQRRMFAISSAMKTQQAIDPKP
jgi:putative membrane protein